MLPLAPLLLLLLLTSSRECLHFTLSPLSTTYRSTMLHSTSTYCRLCCACL
jgi:hypothetical protein